MKEYLASLHNVRAIIEEADKLATLDDDACPEVADAPQGEVLKREGQVASLSVGWRQKLQKPEFLLRMIAVQGANDWKTDIDSHDIMVKLNNALGSITSLSIFYDMLEEEFLTCDFLLVLTLLPRHLKDHGRLPDEVDGIIVSQKHLRHLLQARVQYLMATFVKQSVSITIDHLEWLQSNMGLVCRMDSCVPHKDMWVRVWEFLLSRIEPAVQGEALSKNDVAKEMGRRLDCANMMANPPKIDLSCNLTTNQDVKEEHTANKKRGENIAGAIRGKVGKADKGSKGDNNAKGKGKTSESKKRVSVADYVNTFSLEFEVEIPKAKVAMNSELSGAEVSEVSAVVEVTADAMVEPEIIRLPEKHLRGFLTFLASEVHHRNTNVRTADSGVSSLEMEMNGKKATFIVDKYQANISLNFAGTVSLEHKPNSIKFGDLYGVRWP